jgi:hypothetical protein
VGNIVLSLQAVHRTEYRSPFVATPRMRQPPVEHSHPDGVVTQRLMAKCGSYLAYLPYRNILIPFVNLAVSIVGYGCSVRCAA